MACHSRCTTRLGLPGPKELFNDRLFIIARLTLGGCGVLPTLTANNTITATCSLCT